jgi:uncharacterized protein DUF1707
MAMRYYAPFPGSDGEPPRPRGGPHALRIGDAERDAAAADLGEHYAAGRLSLDELNERLDAVFASKTFGQLTRVLADLPGPGRLRWRAGFPGDGPFGMGDRPWHGTRSSMVGFQTKGPQAPPTPTDRAGRFAALSLLLLAMLIWLFTALLFARHGFYHSYGPYGPPGSFGHFVPGGFQPGGPGSPPGP